ncbi:MAG: hypothetical protein R3358_04475 [Woeseiaceae bacterium]|nr:hypothetical protein [Woeseiaceae bacterium]
MIEQILSSLSAFGSSLYGAFVFPGEVLFGWFALVAPEKAEVMRHNNGEIIYPLILALVVWTLLIAVGLRILRGFMYVGRLIESMIRTAIYHTTTMFRNIRLAIIWKLRALFPKRAAEAMATSSELELDNLDYAVLRCALKVGESCSVSAKDLAKRLRMRPAQVQQSIEKLARHNMLDREGRSWKGFGSYRVTKAGEMFIGMMRRSEATASPGHA